MSGFWAIHRALPREGPGDRTSLDWALRMAAVRPDAAICDAGCGPGADIPALLAHVPRGRVHAVDAHAPFAGHVRARFAGDRRVTVEHGDMTALTGPFDFIWCAGAVYAVGIGAALPAFHRALRPGGKAAFSHLCWLGEDRPPEAAAFWAEEYPAMPDIAGAAAEIALTGARILGRTLVSPQGWEAYYTPLEARLDALEPDAPDALADTIAAHRREIDVWRSHGDSFGYVLFLVAP